MRDGPRWGRSGRGLFSEIRRCMDGRRAADERPLLLHLMRSLLIYGFPRGRSEVPFTFSDVKGDRTAETRNLHISGKMNCRDWLLEGLTRLRDDQTIRTFHYVQNLFQRGSISVGCCSFPIGVHNRQTTLIGM